MKSGVDMDKTLRKVSDLAEQQAETYRYWRSRSPAKRFKATWELSRDCYQDFDRQKGITKYVEGSTRSFIRVQRTQR